MEFLRAVATAGSRSLPLPWERTFLPFHFKCKLSPSLSEIPPGAGTNPGIQHQLVPRAELESRDAAAEFVGFPSGWIPVHFLREIRGEAGGKFWSAADLQHLMLVLTQNCVSLLSPPPLFTLFTPRALWIARNPHPQTPGKSVQPSRGGE